MINCKSRRRGPNRKKILRRYGVYQAANYNPDFYGKLSAGVVSAHADRDYYLKVIESASDLTLDSTANAALQDLREALNSGCLNMRQLQVLEALADKMEEAA